VATSVATYIFEHTWERELERLTGLERWADGESFRHLDGIVEAGWRCLDIGAGAGSVTRHLARRVGESGSVMAADLETGLLEQLVDEPNVEILRCDILDGGLPEEEFDLAHARFVLVHIPEREQALDRMIEALRPGGWIFLTDLDWRTMRPAYPTPVGERVERAVREAFTQAGLELDYGPRIPYQLEEHGLVDVEGQAFIRHQHGTSTGAEVYRLTIERLRDAIVAGGIASSADIDQVQAALRDPAYTIFTPTIWSVWGRKPA
jgi:ubiquinone/menaquinone biosynthesis C-methylase UbiE